MQLESLSHDMGDGQVHLLHHLWQLGQRLYQSTRPALSPFVEKHMPNTRVALSNVKGSMNRVGVTPVYRANNKAPTVGLPGTGGHLVLRVLVCVRTVPRVRVPQPHLPKTLSR